MLLFLKNLVFTLVVPGTFAVYLPWLIARALPIGSLGYVLTSSVLFLIGGTIYIWCLWDFATFGRGTPAPIDAPKRLLVRGLYRYTRNPMYVGVLIIIVGWAVLFQAPTLALYAFAVGVAFHLFVVLYEEPHLRRLFGVEYGNYCSRVSRWLPTVSFSSAPKADGPCSGDAQPVDAPDRLPAGSRPPTNGR
jgi:protein-S-isoprenylcysteine O-methyltransferase Ste14